MPLAVYSLQFMFNSNFQVAVDKSLNFSRPWQSDRLKVDHFSDHLLIIPWKSSLLHSSWFVVSNMGTPCWGLLRVTVSTRSYFSELPRLQISLACCLSLTKQSTTEAWMFNFLQFIKKIPTSLTDRHTRGRTSLTTRLRSYCFMPEMVGVIDMSILPRLHPLKQYDL